uniref:Uncharacterized protein n=1 Tax=Arundo donax TaxID=35708 RepID=A0A0A9CCY9_ARUDO
MKLDLQPRSEMSFSFPFNQIRI